MAAPFVVLDGAAVPPVTLASPGQSNPADETLRVG